MMLGDSEYHKLPLQTVRMLFLLFVDRTGNDTRNPVPLKVTLGVPPF